ncbi:MAG TPA: prolipoprotein diacylglyceryl transferase [Thermodesulfobacteriota bacterium]|nr:prolipoprotein diacylglyceryl transferase [Thermodesulfobacteriota bacterium]
MYPVLFRIGDVVISSYSVMVLLAFLVGYWLGEIELKRRGLNGNLADLLLLACVLGGIGGGKVLFLLQNVTLSELVADPVQYLSSGLTFYGGLIGALLLIGLVVWKKKVSYWAVTDSLAPGLILAYAVGRVGCFLVGDDYGTPSDLPWAMAFPHGAPPTMERVHPTQVYDTLLMIGLFLFIWKIRKKERPNGWLSSVMFILLGIERFLIEFIRNTSPSFIPGLSQAQLISVGIIILGVLKLIQLRAAAKARS